MPSKRGRLASQLADQQSAKRTATFRDIDPNALMKLAEALFKKKAADTDVELDAGSTVRRCERPSIANLCAERAHELARRV